MSLRMSLHVNEEMPKSQQFPPNLTTLGNDYLCNPVTSDYISGRRGRRAGL